MKIETSPRDGGGEVSKLVVKHEQTVYFGHGEGDEAVVVGRVVVAVDGQDRVGVVFALFRGGHRLDREGRDGEDRVAKP